MTAPEAQIETSLKCASHIACSLSGDHYAVEQTHTYMHIYANSVLRFELKISADLGHAQ